VIHSFSSSHIHLFKPFIKKFHPQFYSVEALNSTKSNIASQTTIQSKMSYPTEQTAVPAYETNPQSNIQLNPQVYNQPNSGSNEKAVAQQGFPQGVPQQTPPKNNYLMATPLASLQQSPSPVDCPVCGVREMTRVEFVPGGTTQ
jgi:hypothetical protein